MKSVLFWVLFGAVMANTIAEVIDLRPCNTGRDANIVSELHEVQVDPCPEAEEEEPCSLARGSNATVTIKFTPSAAPSRLKSSIAWVNNGNDMTFRGMRPDACTYMDCPVKVDEQNTFAATLSLGSNLPTGLYPLKVKLQELRGRKKVFACVLFDIRLQ